MGRGFRAIGRAASAMRLATPPPPPVGGSSLLTRVTPASGMQRVPTNQYQSAEARNQNLVYALLWASGCGFLCFCAMVSDQHTQANAANPYHAAPGIFNDTVNTDQARLGECFVGPLGIEATAASSPSACSCANN